VISAPRLDRSEDFAEFLERDLNKQLLHFTTAGSVDDGKSTLIGRLLHDSKAVYEDQLASVRKSRVNRSGKAIDFSLLTDGLRAEREQGITIDVAYRYFSTARRKFIIADTPGHEQYTRNMATGASTADLTIILVDATKGLLPQTRRHAYISSLLGIPRVVAAINKMDLVGYAEDVFLKLADDFRQLAHSLGLASVHCIPLSALEGDNVVDESPNMPWYTGATLMEFLETVELRSLNNSREFRFPVQSVIRPDANFRGFAGRIASGTIRPGDAVLALPSQRQTRVKTIVAYTGELDIAIPQQSVVLELEDEIDLSRGDLLVSPDSPPFSSNRFTAMVVWLHAQPFELNRTYFLKHGGRLIKAKATQIRFRVNVNDLTEHTADRLQLNEIASVEFEASSPLFFDTYQENRATGSFILIDPLSNATVGAAMIREPIFANSSALGAQSPDSSLLTGVEQFEREERHGHRSAILAVNGNGDLARRLEKILFDHGFEALLIRANQFPNSTLPAHLQTLLSVGILIVYASESRSPADRSALELAAGEHYLELPVHSQFTTGEELLQRALDFAETLRTKGNSSPEEGATRT
jgi:sulfate adenylyltransferase subunit 1